MAFTTGNVSVPASGGGVVLVYQTSNSVPVNVALSVDTGGELYLLHGSGQTPSTGFRMSAPTVMHGFVGSIYAAGLNSAYTLSFAVSSVE